MINNSKIYASTLEGLLRDVRETTERGDDVGQFMTSIIEFAIPLAVVSVFVLLSFAAFKLMTSQGNPDKLKDAREQISNAIIGFIFVILSVAILLLLGNILNIGVGG